MIAEQGLQDVIVPPLTLVFLVVWSQTPWLVQLVALTRLTVVPSLSDTLKKPRPRPQALAVTVPRVVLLLVFAVRKPA